jgi:hypothetical protein
MGIFSSPENGEDGLPACQKLAVGLLDFAELLLGHWASAPSFVRYRTRPAIIARRIARRQRGILISGAGAGSST